MSTSARNIPIYIPSNVERKPMNLDVYGDSVQKCPDCGSKNIFKDSKKAEIICRSCGNVIDENIIDLGPEWRNYQDNNGKNNSRVGAPRNIGLHDGGLTTVVGPGNKDAHGNNVTLDKAKLARMRKWQVRARIANHKERSLSIALNFVNNFCSTLGLPNNIRKQTASIYRQASDKKLIRGRSIEGVAAASVYIACRRSNIPRTLDEIANATSVNKKELGRVYRQINSKLNINLTTTSPSGYIPRFASDLGLSGEVEAKAINLIEEAKKQGLISGRKPSGIAAAALYVAAILNGERKTQKEIAKVSNVSEVTIRNIYRDFSEKISMDVTL